MRLTRIDTAGEDGLQVLCLGAHPDDIEIGCGGTIRRICRENPSAFIHWVVLSCHGVRSDEARVGADRFREGSAGGDLEMGTFRDGFFPSRGEAIKEFFEALKARINPDVIFTHFREDRHQDHRLVSDLTWNTWRDHLILEYEVPKWDGDLGAPNAFVPLTEAYAEEKIAGILEAFPSQRGKHWFGPETFRGLLRLRGNECRSPTGHAEAFYARKVIVL